MLKLVQFHPAFGIRNLSPFCLKLETYLRKGVRTQLYSQGTGRHTPDEIYRFGLQSLSAIETQLDDHDFMLGDAPSSLDATAYGFLAQLTDTDFLNPLNSKAQSTPSVVAYCARMKQRYFSDLL